MVTPHQTKNKKSQINNYLVITSFRVGKPSCMSPICLVLHKCFKVNVMYDHLKKKKKKNSCMLDGCLSKPWKTEEAITLEHFRMSSHK